MKTKTTASTLLVIGLFSAGTSSAGSLCIDVKGLDLSRQEVAARVYARIERGARLLCRDTSSSWDGTKVTTWKRCVSAAIDGAVQQANAPGLKALHRSKLHPGDLAGLTR